MDQTIVVVLKGIIIWNKKVLIIQRSSAEEIGGGTWEFVGGKIDFGEELEEALKREIHEEVGLEVKVDHLLYASTFFSHEHRQIIVMTYLCYSDTGEVNLSFEHQDYKWANKDRMEEYLYQGILEDLHKNDIYQKLGII